MTARPQTPPPRTATLGAMLAVGTVVDDRYEIVDLLGQGGFSVVYAARHIHMNRPVALKVLSEAGEERGGHERFLQEARSVAAIDHPNILRVHDCRMVEGGQTYIAAQLLDGWDLDQELDALGPMSAARALSLLVPCLDGLAEAHAAGIVHKDIKPSNLFVHRPEGSYERLVLLDFGASAALHGGMDRLTSKLELVGTIQYLAPEYIDRQLVTPALDVYQMGLILVEMLTGRRAVEAEHPLQALNMHCRGALDVPAEIRRGPLGAVLERALALDPAERYADASALRDALATLDLSLPAPRHPDETSRYVCVPRELPTLRMPQEVVDPVGDVLDGSDETLDQPIALPVPASAEVAMEPVVSITGHTPRRRGSWRRFLAAAAVVLGLAGAAYGTWVASTWYPDMRSSVQTAIDASGHALALRWSESRTSAN